MCGGGDATVDKQTSDRICKHMNDDHASSVYGMALTTLSRKEEISATFEIKDAQLKSISLRDYTIKYVVCSGQMCEMRTKVVPFDPPIDSMKDIKKRLISIHYDVLSPKIEWLYEDPIAFTFLFGMFMLGLITFIGKDHEKLANEVYFIKKLFMFVKDMFGNEAVIPFLQISRLLFFAAIIIHSFEALYAVYLCQKVLKLKPNHILPWYLMVSFIGYPILRKLLTFANIQKQSKERSSQTKTTNNTSDSNSRRQKSDRLKKED